MITRRTIYRGGRNAVKVIMNLTKYIIPAILVLKILEHSGWLIRISDFFAPYMAYIGLPGEGALVVMMGQVSLYSAIAGIVTLDLTVKQLTIMSTFVSIFHACAVETAVVSKGGGNGWLIVALRLVGAFLACSIMNIIIPGV